MRQRSNLEEHRYVRQYEVSSRLSRYTAGPACRMVMCGRPAGCKKNLRFRLLRVIGCCHVFGLSLRLRHGRGPVWEFEDQVHITGTRSKRSPCVWFS